MGSRNNPGAFDCYSAAHPDEPMFVLLGRDPSAHLLVWLWAELRRRLGGEDVAKIQEALDCSTALEQWSVKLGKLEKLHKTSVVWNRMLRPRGERDVPHFISQSCIGEECACGAPATHKLGEEIAADDPHQDRHNLTAYVCCREFAALVGHAGGCR